MTNWFVYWKKTLLEWRNVCDNWWCVVSDNHPPSVERMDRRRDEPNRGMRFPRGGRGRGSPYWAGAKIKDSDDRYVIIMYHNW